MSVRTAVLLSAVFIGVVALYLETRDQWNWTKLMRRLIFGLLLLVGGIGGWIYFKLQPAEPKQ